jgi:hypothetical protein
MQATANKEKYRQIAEKTVFLSSKLNALAEKLIAQSGNGNKSTIIQDNKQGFKQINQFI